ncbi:hypothetical protein GOP47_0017441 [Adiantum capillus-veneris]|uniref:NADP-dependent oxidoreductase domain-containing protein n=1 Tax=Adiantum capillus-veneris TaxID=13818 RepID=A0A9D4UFB8_ADICA|nr:hypothetical protein GOP47_0017441 [Adiantum capillus-veneris]
MASLVSEGAAALLSKGAFHHHHQHQYSRKMKTPSVSQRFRASSTSPSTDTPTSNSSTAILQASADKVRLGASDVEVTKVGIGAWSWGDTFYWNNGSWNDRNIEDARAAFNASVDVGINFFDTAEVYGSQIMGVGGESERLLGRFVKERNRLDSKGIAIATKFAALPWRLGRGSLICALKESLKRLDLSSVDLYQLHWPGLWGNEGYIDGLADAVEQGLVKAVGVSNYNEQRLRSAYAQLKKRGIPLASNQVNYSLIYRLPEKNGVKKACDELGVTLIAYSPIGQGVLSGKYTPKNPPSGPRGRIYNKEYLTKATPLLQALREIAQQHGKTPLQVSLNWLMAQENVVPIPGAKTAAQAKEFAGALGWTLTSSEVDELRRLASKLDPITGFPAESF